MTTASEAASFQPKSDFLRVMIERGYVHQLSHAEELDAAALAGPITAYIGFDATADSLHVGSLVQIMLLRRLQQTGHKPIVVMGGGTTKVGDPSGKDSQRQMLTPAQINANIAGLKRAFEPFLRFGAGPSDAITVDNDEWLSKLGYVEFLREYGPHFTINRMLTFDSVKLRLEREQPLTFLEFNYMLMQATDFLELNRRYGCTLQTGGSDQWGNLTAGTELIRKADGKSVHALGTPLITKADGTKFGKTETGTLWLDPELTTPYAFYQFWLNADDRDVANYLRIFTFRSREEIQELERLTVEQPAARAAQRALAEDITALVHGEEQLARAVAASRALFGQGDLADLDAATLAAATAELPSAQVTELGSLVDLFVATGLVTSKSAARRAVKEGGAYLNNVKVTDEKATATSADLLHGRWLLLRRGKRNLAAVQLTS